MESDSTRVNLFIINFEEEGKCEAFFSCLSKNARERGRVVHQLRRYMQNDREKKEVGYIFMPDDAA